MSTRYINSKYFNSIDSQTARKILKDRDITNTRIAETIYVNPLSQDERKQYAVRTSIWQRRTRLFKLAHAFYGDSTLWWVIAWFNQKPTDADYSIGDVVYIPFPLEKIIDRITR